MTDYAKMNLTELKSAAKDAGLKGYSKMNKADLVEALDKTVEPAKMSVVEGIQAAIRNAKDAKRMSGMAAGLRAKKTEKQTIADKVAAYREQRNGGKLTARQARRVRKATNQGVVAF